MDEKVDGVIANRMEPSYLVIQGESKVSKDPAGMVAISGTFVEKPVQAVDDAVFHDGGTIIKDERRLEGPSVYNAGNRSY
ncbi:hypothetical protein [Geobacter sp. DSM 9736]|uniref:hypothetical protein n=1 Tax=Geobacter sp. DSM 9736 TaxID=1277350 RepID=UPI000B513F18|nr:hypothetical protein [Geobacter sp. DSM 9736]